MAAAYLYCVQKGIHFPSDDYSRTPAVLFIWLKAQMICIDSFIVELGIVSMKAGKMGPITASDASL